MLKVFKTFFRYNLRSPWLFTGSTIAVILAAIGSNSTAIVLKLLLDKVNAGDMDLIVQFIVIALAIQLASLTFWQIAYLLGDTYSFRAGRDLRLDVFAHLHKLDFSYHSEKRSGSLISKIRRGDGAFFSVFHALNIGILRLFVEFMFIVTTLAFIDASLVAIVFVIVAIGVFISKFLLQLNIKKRIEFNAAEDNISHVIVDNMVNYDTVKYFAKEEWERSRMADRYVDWMRVLWQYANSFRAIDISTGLLSIIGGTSLTLFSIYQVTRGEMSLGSLVLVIIFSTTFFPKLEDLVYKLRDITKNYSDLKDYVELLDEEITVKEKKDATTLNVSGGKIEIANVSFGYKDRAHVLHDVNLTINPGESIAFVGTSGAGKTTLTKLLLRFYDITAGSISIDGQNIQNVTKASLRSNIGVVPQDPALFNDTLGFNLKYGKPEATDAEALEAARKANLLEFIESLPEGMATLVGERGIKLSGGQRQRLAIARMFLEDPPIIIFDEATSQLDSESEKLIQEAFWKVAQGRTTIIIAHRLSTVMRADRIIVLGSGQIRQTGTHEELIAQSGIYQKLWSLQQGKEMI